MEIRVWSIHSSQQDSTIMLGKFLWQIQRKKAAIDFDEYNICTNVLLPCTISFSSSLTSAFFLAQSEPVIRRREQQLFNLSLRQHHSGSSQPDQPWVGKEKQRYLEDANTDRHSLARCLFSLLQITTQKEGNKSDQIAFVRVSLGLVKKVRSDQASPVIT